MAGWRGGVQFVCMYVGGVDSSVEGKGGVMCAFCVWLLCLPVITPCNLAVKGWP